METEPFPRRRPDVWRGLVAEVVAIGSQGAFVPISEAGRGGRFSSGWSVMKRRSENLAAELLPIGPRIAKMEVPGLIHRIGGHHGMVYFLRQKQEPFVLGEHPFSEGSGPTVFTGQPFGVRIGCGRIIEFELIQSSPKRGMVSGFDHVI